MKQNGHLRHFCYWSFIFCPQLAFASEETFCLFHFDSPHVAGGFLPLCCLLHLCSNHRSHMSYFIYYITYAWQLEISSYVRENFRDVPSSCAKLFIFKNIIIIHMSHRQSCSNEWPTWHVMKNIVFLLKKKLCI